MDYVILKTQLKCTNKPTGRKQETNNRAEKDRGNNKENSGRDDY